MASTDTPSLPLSTMIHMVNIKLSSSNYLLWHAQIEPLLTSQQFMPMLDGTSSPPPTTVRDAAGIVAPNPDYTAWQQRDQLVKLFLVSTLTEDSMAVVIGCNSSRDVWTPLSGAYSNGSKARELSLKDDLLSIKRGDKSVPDYARHFKNLSDQLAAIGRPIDESDKSHWFLRGLGADFSNFASAQMTQDPLPNFTTLVARAQSHELFQKSLDQSNASQGVSQAAFTAVNRGRGRYTGRGRGSSSNSGRGGQNSHHNRGRKNYTPHCFFCRETDHDGFDCPKRFDRNYDLSCRPLNTANIAEAFSAGCNVSPVTPSDWYLDTRASAHMAAGTSHLDNVSTYSGTDHVPVGNGANLSISHTGSFSLSHDITLRDILVVPGLTKNLLSVSKLTRDFPVQVVFTDSKFHIQTRDTGKVLATGTRDR